MEGAPGARTVVRERVQDLSADIESAVSRVRGRIAPPPNLFS